MSPVNPALPFGVTQYYAALAQSDDPEIDPIAAQFVGSDKEQLVLVLYYYEELTMREIGEVLGITESRVSQIHSKAVFRK